MLRPTSAALLALGLLACGPAAPSDEPVPTPALRTPRWAFEPWISKDISDATDSRDFVQGFLDRDIPVGVLVLDSPWETNYHTFVPSPTRYPGFAAMVADLRAKGVRTVCWMTQMINEASLDLEPGGDRYAGASPNFQEALDRGFFVNDGERYLWWKGQGAALDFFNPEAVRWWHAQQDAVLDLGIAGWKLDFGDEYVRTPVVRTAAGEVPRQRYSEEYYRDFLAYGVHRAGRDFVTMVRPWDESYGFQGRFHARPEHAPVAWVGDNRRDWIGLADALDHILRSAAAGYTMLGSDIGGYLDRDDEDLSELVPWDPLVFLRWTALGALTPFMQLHGRANIAPWTVPARVDDTVAAWRFWATLHHELVPFFHSLVAEAQAGRGSALAPAGPPETWPGDYRFLLGEALLVAPVLGPGPKRRVVLPAGARWHDWWAPGAAGVDGGTEVEVETPDDRIPLFVREGAIIPADVGGALTGLGTGRPTGALTLLVWPGRAPSRFSVHEADDSVVSVSVERGEGLARIDLSRVPRTTLLRVRVEPLPSAVRVGPDLLPQRADRAALDQGPGWAPDAASRAVWVRLEPAAPATRVVLVP